MAYVKLIEMGTEEYDLYSDLMSDRKGKKAIGRGEASGIALAKVYDGVLASNNYKDLNPYIKMYNLKHIDTGQILFEALQKNLITEKEGEDIWQQMIKKKRTLPTSTFHKYLERVTYCQETSNIFIKESQVLYCC